MWVMAFSPAIYASGSRPRFLCYLFLICNELKLISKFAFNNNEKRKELSDVILGRY